MLGDAGGQRTFHAHGAGGAELLAAEASDTLSANDVRLAVSDRDGIGGTPLDTVAAGRTAVGNYRLRAQKHIQALLHQRLDERIRRIVIKPARRRPRPCKIHNSVFSGIFRGSDRNLPGQ